MSWGNYRTFVFIIQTAQNKGGGGYITDVLRARCSIREWPWSQRQSPLHTINYPKNMARKSLTLFPCLTLFLIGHNKVAQVNLDTPLCVYPNRPIVDILAAPFLHHCPITAVRHDVDSRDSWYRADRSNPQSGIITSGSSFMSHWPRCSGATCRKRLQHCGPPWTLWRWADSIIRDVFCMFVCVCGVNYE